MEDNNEMTCDETHFQKIDQSIIKKPRLKDYIETKTLEMHPIPTKEQHHIPKRGRGRPRKKRLDVKTESSTTSKVNYSTVDSELGLKKIRYRPIRPKPFPPGASLLRHKLFETPFMLNMSTLTSNRVIVTVPEKDKTQNTASNDVSKTTVDNNETRNISKESKGKESKTNEKTVENSNIKINIEKGLRKAKSVSPCKSSIELFFESMAQTVLNLPMEVQADIKMKICKLVTMAEMKYCGSHKSKTD